MEFPLIVNKTFKTIICFSVKHIFAFNQNFPGGNIQYFSCINNLLYLVSKGVIWQVNGISVESLSVIFLLILINHDSNNNNDDNAKGDKETYEKLLSPRPGC